MYVPTHFAADDAAVHDLLSQPSAADLVTVTPVGLLASLLPFIYDPTVGRHGTLLAHLARANEQWRQPVIGEALAIVRGPDAYVSPSWYASKTEHGRVVPTWNYITAHIYGTVTVHDDPAWVEQLVRRLTNQHEAHRADPWSVDDAPDKFIAGQLRAIVGVELAISRVEAKFKLSQNRPEADITGVVNGLEAHGDTAAATAVSNFRPGGR